MIANVPMIRSTVRPMHRLKASRSRCGVTLIECMIIFLLIAILIMLLLPLLESAREAARNQACKNNLRQIGVALQEHVKAKEAFPTGYYCAPPANKQGGDEATWITFLLPYLGHEDLYRQIDWQHQFGLASNPEHWNLPITSAFLSDSSFQCSRLT